MAKLTAWLVTFVGALLVLQLLMPAVFAGMYFNWALALSVLVIGIGKLLRNYGLVKKRK
ncbi:hypothetical protein M0R72_10050 [Candidatus Pacearchaeota archaeon]|jgi:hypothetical protein|nr:hypothetical protein [Candidatus Pacearchaeota archaeon]